MQYLNYDLLIINNIYNPLRYDPDIIMLTSFLRFISINPIETLHEAIGACNCKDELLQTMVYQLDFDNTNYENYSIIGIRKEFCIVTYLQVIMEYSNNRQEEIFDNIKTKIFYVSN